MPKTHWSEPNGATSDRGWLKALCAPFDSALARTYTHSTMPVIDTDVPGGWREQTTLGTYLDYTIPHCMTYSPAELKARWPNGNVLCCCFAANTNRHVHTVAEARAWITAEALRARPDLEAPDA